MVRIGITDYAQNSLGDIVFVSVHSLDDAVSVGDTLGEVESTKSVSDLYAPVAGRVVARNEALDDNPELMNSDPYGEGWVAEIEVEDPAVLESLLDAEAYRTARLLSKPPPRVDPYRRSELGSPEPEQPVPACRARPDTDRPTRYEGR